MDNSVTPPNGGVTISLIEEYNIPVPEPSGLSLSNDFKSLWTVSDNTGDIYNITLDGTLISKLDYNGSDLEGIAIDPRDSTIWIVQEGSREIIHLDISGKEISRNKIDVSGTGSNSGLEGICFDKNLTHNVINEKSPMLWVKLNSDFSISTEKELSISSDLSGIVYDNSRNIFWIVSDKSKLLLQWEPSKGLLNSFDLPFKKAEGVAINTIKQLIYIVSDATQKLYVYKIETK